MSASNQPLCPYLQVVKIDMKAMQIEDEYVFNAPPRVMIADAEVVQVF